MKNLLAKIQGLPKPKRKMIFWILVGIMTLALLIFIIKDTQKRFKNFRLNELKQGLPKIEIPKYQMKF